jgi:hypothetical protein
MISLLLLSEQVLHAQISTTLQVTPPYAPYLSDYTSRINAMVINLTNTTAQPQTVYFSGSVTGDNGVSAYTKQNFKPPAG